MPRFHATVNGPVQYTAEEEAARDAEDAFWAAEKAKPTTPTKQQLMAELAALTAKIQALE